MTRQLHAGRMAPVWRVLTLASVLAVAPVVTGLPQISSPAKPHPVRTQLREVGFVKSSVASMRAAKSATRSAQLTPGVPDPITTARAGAMTAVQDVPGGLAVVGVTWPGWQRVAVSRRRDGRRPAAQARRHGIEHLLYRPALRWTHEP